MASGGESDYYYYYYYYYGADANGDQIKEQYYVGGYNTARSLRWGKKARVGEK
jgi:hypothetical protein